MSEVRCPTCDRVEARNDYLKIGEGVPQDGRCWCYANRPDSGGTPESVQAFLAVDRAAKEDCDAHRVDWRQRALEAECEVHVVKTLLAEPDHHYEPDGSRVSYAEAYLGFLRKTFQIKVAAPSKELPSPDDPQALAQIKEILKEPFYPHGNFLCGSDEKLRRMRDLLGVKARAAFTGTIADMRKRPGKNWKTCPFPTHADDCACNGEGIG